MLFQAEHILHVVDPGLLFYDPLRGAKSAVGKGVTAGSFVGEFEPLAGVRKNDRVIADNIAAANRMDAYFRTGPLADDSDPAVPRHFFKLLVSDFRENFRQ